MDFSSLFKKGITLISVKTSQVMGTSKKLSDAGKTAIAERNDMAPERLNATKVIAKSENLKKLTSEKTAFMAWITEHCVPATEFLRSGCYFIDRSLLEDLENQHAQTLQNCDSLLVALKEEWSSIREASRRELGHEWSEDLLPETPDALIAQFGITYQAFELSIPDGMDPATHQRELDKANGALKSAYREVELTLRDEMISAGNPNGLLVALKKRLDSFGQTKGDRFREALLTNVLDWCARVPQRNISENPQIAQLADLVYASVSSWNVDRFRDDAKEREQASEKIAEFIREFDRV
jgi:hypothetical protein